MFKLSLTTPPFPGLDWGGVHLRWKHQPKIQPNCPFWNPGNYVCAMQSTIWPSFNNLISCDKCVHRNYIGSCLSIDLPANIRLALRRNRNQNNTKNKYKKNLWWQVEWDIEKQIYSICGKTNTRVQKWQDKVNCITTDQWMLRITKPQTSLPVTEQTHGY